MPLTEEQQKQKGINDTAEGQDSDSNQQEPSPIPEDIIEAVADHSKGTRTDLDTTLSREYLSPTASFEELAVKIPELRDMVGFDQKSDFHSLTLADHTKRMAQNLANDEALKDNPKRELILLAGMLHDLGKLSEEGRQVHPKDPSKLQYLGHEDQSAIMARDVIDKHFGLGAEDKEFVATLTGLHASALSLIGSFESSMKGDKKELKGKQLQAFEKFVAKAEEIPGEISTEEKMRIILALNRADKMAGFNEESDMNDPKVQGIKDKAEAQVSILNEMSKALPALLEAIEARKQGKANAGIKLVEDKYVFDDGVVANKPAQESAIPGAVMGKIAKEYTELGLPVEQKGEFMKVLKEGGIPALGKAGFGKYIGIVKKLMA